MPGKDTRIVQMQFDNRDFEKNIAVSQESLERFKDELDFDEQENNLRDFGDAVKNFNFNTLQDNIQRLTDKFTGLGTISELVLSQIRRGIESAAAKMSSFINSLTFAQVSEGQEKFNMLNKSVQTIKAATGLAESEVYSVMERLNQYTDQTSYNFADMAQNIGKFTSVGIPLEKAERQMEGIANWAARSGAGINEASRAMYNLSQAMGVGSLKLMDWKSIENAGMATKEFKEQLIQAGVAAGTLVQTIDKKTGKVVYKTAKSLGKQVEVDYTNLSSTLNKGWANKTVLGNTLEHYYWDDLYYNGTEALIKLDDEQKKIFDEMLNDGSINAKDWKKLESMGIITEENKQKLLDLAESNGKLTKEVKEDGTVIYKAVDKNGKEIEFTIDKIEESLSTGWFDKNLGETATTVNEFAKECYEAAQKCLTFTDVIQAWKDQISTGFMNTFKHIFGELSESMELFSAICNKVGESFTKVTNMINGYTDENGNEHAGIFGNWANMGGRNSLWGIFVGEYDGMFEGAVGILDIFAKVGDMISDGFWHLVRLIHPASLMDEAFNQNWDMNEDYRAQFIAEKMMEVTEGIQNFIKGFKDFFNEIPEGYTKSRGQMIQDVVNGIAASFLLIFTIGKRVITFFRNLISKIDITPIINLLSKLGLAISGTAHDAATGTGLTDFFNGLLEALNPLIEPINKIIKLVSELIGKIVEGGTKNGTFNKILDFFGKLLTLVVDIVSNVAGPLIDFVGDIIDAFSGLFEEGINEASMKKFGTKLTKAIEKLVDGILEGVFGKDAGKKINEFFGYIFGFDDKNGIEGEATTALGAIKMWIQKIFGVVGGLFDGFKNEEGEVTLFSLLKERLGIGSAVKFLKDINNIFAGSNIFKLLKTFGTLLTIFKAFKMLSAGKQMFGTIGDFFGGLGDSLKNGIKLDLTQKTETTGEKLLKIAKGIALIAAAVAVLGSMKISSLIKGIAVIGIIYLILTSLMKTMSKNTIAIQNVAAIGLLGFALVGMIIGLTLLILALKPLAKMNIEQIASMLTGFAGIILILGLFAQYVTKDTKNIKARDMFAIALMAIGIGFLVRSIRPLSKVSWEGLLKMGVGLAAILYMIQQFSKTTGTMDDKGIGKTILLAAGILLIVRAILPIAEVSIDGMLKMLISFGAILFMLQKFAKTFGTLKGTGLGAAITLAIGIWLLVQTLLPLKDVSWEGLAKMGAGLAVVLLMLKMFNSALGSYRFGEMAGVIAVALGIWLVVRALLPLANVSWEGMAKMGVGLIALMIVLQTVMNLCEGMKIREAIASIIAMVGLAVVLLLFGLSMGMMSDVKWSTIVVAVLALSVLMIVYFAMIDYINSNEKSLLKGAHALVAMVGLAAVMLVFSMAMNEIKTMKVDKILAFSLGLAALIIALGIALEITSKMTLGGAIKGILILAVAIAAIMAVLALLMPMVIGAIGSSLEKMAAKLSIIGNLFTQFVANMSGFTEEQVDEAKRKFESIYNLVTSLKDASSYMKSLTDFTTMIRKLGSALNLYATLTKDVNGPENDPAYKLLEKICGLKDQINGLSIGTFGDDLAVLGGALATFVNPEGNNSVTTAEPTAYKLLQNILNCKSQIEAFSKLDLTGFTERLQGLGGALSLYAMGAKEVTGLTEEELSADGIGGAVKIMQAISQSLTENGGFAIPDLPTETDLKDFPSQLAALANAVVAYANACKEFDDGKADAGLAAIDFLGELNGKLTEDNVKIAEKTKDIKTNVMARFATNIRLLGGALYSFYDKTKDFGDITNAEHALTFFKQLGTDLTKESIKATLMFEGTDVTPETLGTFADDIVALGGALQSFATNTKFDADTSTTFDNAVIALKDLVKMRNSMPNVGGIVEWFTGHKGNFQELADDITIMGAGLANLSKALSGDAQEGVESLGQYNAELVGQALNSLSAIVDIIKTMTTIPDEQLFNDNFYANFLSSFVDTLTTSEGYTSFEHGEITFKKFSESIAKMMSDISEAVNKFNGTNGEIDQTSITMFANFADGLVKIVNSAQYVSFTDVGYNIAKGIADGMDGNDADEVLSIAARNMIIKIWNAATQEADEHSPSVLFRDTVGRYIALGVAKGIDDNADKSADAAEDMVKNTLFGAEGALSVLSKLINGEIDYDPTIRPILDLTNVETGMQQLNGWFGNTGFNLNGGSFTIDPSKATIYADTAMPQDYTENIAKIGEEVSNLREDIQVLGNAIKNMKLVMNTGAVVGAIGPEMDTYLGQRGFYAARTNI